MGTLVVVNVLDSGVRCVTNQIPFYRPSLSVMLVLSDVLAFQKSQFQFISLLSLKLFLKYIQQYSQHLVHLIFIIKQSTKKIQLYLNLPISVSYHDQKSESFCA